MVRIVSGGQTGVDRAALDAAIELSIPHGGWCPKGRRAEDGRIPAQYRLTETAAREYWVRTEQNVVDSDATLILYRHRLSGGTEFTFRMTRKHGKPCLSIELEQGDHWESYLAWLQQHRVQVLNCAGPRESTMPGIYQHAKIFFIQLWRRWADGVDGGQTAADK